MKKSYSLILFLMILSSQLFSQNSYEVYFNEIKPNDGGAGQEYIELIGPSGTSLTGLIITHYNGSATSDGGLWIYTIIGSATIADDCGNGKGVYVIGDAAVTNVDEIWSASNTLQNGPDGLVLYDTDGTTVLDAIAWEGTGDMLTDDPGAPLTQLGDPCANAFLHETIDDNSTTNSLQAKNNVMCDLGSNWELVSPTPGALNTNQTCDVPLPVELSSFTAKSVSGGVSLKWTTESEVENLGFLLERKTADNDWKEIVSYKNDDSLLGQGSVSFATDYEYIDKLVKRGYTYDYRLADVDYNGMVTYHSTREVLVVNDPLATIANDFTVTAYPNPFNPSTTIRYSLPAIEMQNLASVRISVYDISGKLVTTLVNKEQPSGWYEIQWNGTNQTGKKVPGGVYLSQVAVGNEVKTNKLILLK